MSLPHGKYFHCEEMTDPDFEFVFQPDPKGIKLGYRNLLQQVILYDHRWSEKRAVMYEFEWPFADTIPLFLDAVMERLLRQINVGVPQLGDSPS